PHSHHRVFAAATSQQVLSAVVDDLDRRPDRPCKKSCVGLQPSVQLGAKASADVVADHANVGHSDAEERCDLVTDVERKLAGGMDDVAPVLPTGKGALRFDVRLILAGSAVLGLNYEGGPLEGVCEALRVRIRVQ